MIKKTQKDVFGDSKKSKVPFMGAVPFMDANTCMTVRLLWSKIADFRPNSGHCLFQIFPKTGPLNFENCPKTGQSKFENFLKLTNKSYTLSL